MDEIEDFEIFDSGDAPFIKWMQGNPDGFVIIKTVQVSTYLFG